MKLTRKALIFIILIVSVLSIPFAQSIQRVVSEYVPVLPVVSMAAPKTVAALSITQISWGVVGLDSNRVTDGPDTYMIGARVCNEEDTVVTNVIVNFFWDSANSFVNLASGERSSLTYATLASGACVNSYFRVAVTRNASAYDTARRYHITASAV